MNILRYYYYTEKSMRLNKQKYIFNFVYINTSTGFNIYCLLYTLLKKYMIYYVQFVLKLLGWIRYFKLAPCRLYDFPTNIL